MKLSSIQPFTAPLLFSLLLVAAALLLWRVPAVQAAQYATPVHDCSVLDKTARVDFATRRAETMLTLHRGW